MLLAKIPTPRNTFNKVSPIACSFQKLLLLKFKLLIKRVCCEKCWLNIDAEIWCLIPISLNFTEKEENVKWEMVMMTDLSTELFLRKSTTTVFVSLAKKGLTANESVKTLLLGKMWSLAIGDWILIFEGLVLVIESGHGHLWVRIWNTGDEDAIIAR